MTSTAVPTPAPTQIPAQPQKTHWRWLIGLSVFSLAMMLFFLFGFSSFYSLWCKITGTQMNPNNPTTTPVVVGTREVKVFFESKVYDNLPVRFYPEEPNMTVKVGEDRLTKYRFKNLSDQPVRFRPIHMVSPHIASRHFSMKVCFCFNDQTIAGGESVEYPVMFTFNPDLDERISSVAIRYSLHKIGEGEEQSAQQKRIQQQIEEAGTIVTPGFELKKESAPGASGAPSEVSP
jgi:cytochrome c oxidase assembly protein subunit 11